MNRALAVFNINAGRKKALKYKKKLLIFLRENFDGYKIINIDELCEEQVNKFNTIIAIGGDGTINKVLPYLIGTENVLGIIPCGTANLLAAKLNIPENFDKALNLIKSGKICKIDAMAINKKASILRLGLGFDSDIICKTPQSMKNKFGYFAYFIAGIIFALRLKKKKYILTLDEKIITVQSSCIIVANAANMYKNFAYVANKNSLDDELLDIFVLKTQNPIIFFIEFIKIILGIYKNNNAALYLKSKYIKIQNNWTYGHIDGEKVKFNSDILISVLPKAVNIFVPIKKKKQFE